MEPDSTSENQELETTTPAVSDDSIPNIPQSTTNEAPPEAAPTETTTPATETTTSIEAAADPDEDAEKSETVPEAVAEAVAESPDSAPENILKRKRDESSNETEDSDGPFSKIQRTDEENKDGQKANKQEYTRWSVEPHCSVVRGSATRTAGVNISQVLLNPRNSVDVIASELAKIPIICTNSCPQSASYAYARYHRCVRQSA